MATVGRIERALVIVDSFRRPCCRVGLVDFLVVQILNAVADFIMSNCLIKLPIRHSNQEFDVLVIGSVIIFNFLATEAQKAQQSGIVMNESEANEKFIRAEAGKFEVGQINIKTSQVRGRKQSGRGSGSIVLEFPPPKKLSITRSFR